jgi:hypothetical protein
MDFYEQEASEIFNKPIYLVSEDDRRMAKAIVYSTLYSPVTSLQKINPPSLVVSYNKIMKQLDSGSETEE